MKAIICTKYGAPEVLQIQEIAKPIPKDNEVLIKVYTATATTAGLAGRTGKPAFARLFSGLTKPKNNILGIELAGEIAAVGKDVTVFQKGDRVFGMTGATTPGAYAEFKCMPEDGALLTMPTNMTHEEAAAVVEGGLTALNFLCNQANIQPGQKVLIYGASGAVGTASIQVAKHFGAEVTGVSSTTNVEMVKSLGADAVIDYTKEDFTQNGQTYDIIFDTVGKRSFAQCKGSLTANGIYLDAGNPATILIMLWTSMFSRKKAIMSPTYVRSASALRQDLLVLKELIEAGKIQAVIDRRYPLAQTAEAHRYVETGRKKGNVVINVSAGDRAEEEADGQSVIDRTYAAG
ncbi:NAD(P)-dependent alcohol dehydrogenase [Chloroflexi bacterium TSY]|nr:NAD(P)-dependent alcohol dehydrogenase [Chloroflexi bacterium TSY]